MAHSLSQLASAGPEIGKSATLLAASRKETERPRGGILEQGRTRPKLAAVILTLDEELHLRRCIESLSGLVDEVYVVDCYSQDATGEIALALGAQVLHNPWVSHATQFNWALSQLEPDIEWVLRIDADEYITPRLASEIRNLLPKLDESVAGVYCRRSMVWQGKWIRFGGVFPIDVLRIFRLGKGRCERRWMDEHIMVSGATVRFKGLIIDHNLNTLDWWTQKHNGYATREAVDLLNLEYGFMPVDTVAGFGGGSVSRKRWIKEKIYARLPGGLRAIAYYIYRYVIRFGFLDGAAGASFHFLQGCWYRGLVDAKVAEVKRYVRDNTCSIETAISRVLSIRVDELMKVHSSPAGSLETRSDRKLTVMR